MREVFHVSFPGLGIENLTVPRVFVNIFSLDIYFYSLCICTGLILSLVLASRRAKKFDLSDDDIYTIATFSIPLLIVGARLYYVAFEWERFKGNLLSIFDIRSGGLAFYGGVLGGILAVYIVAKMRKKSVIDYIDYLAPYLALGQAIGRWGNFFNQEAFGGNTTLPWGMISEGTRDYLASIKDNYHNITIDPNMPVHPTFLYESLANILIFILIIHLQNKGLIGKGRRFICTSVYLLTYGITRFIVEGLRTDSLFIANTSIRASQVLSILMVILASFYLSYTYFKSYSSVKSALSVKPVEVVETVDAVEQLAKKKKRKQK